MTQQKAKRLYELESKWVCGGGWCGRNKGTGRKAKKSRLHSGRLSRLRALAGL